MLHVSLAALALLVTALAVAGCGGSSKTASTSASTDATATATTASTATARTASTAAANVTAPPTVTIKIAQGKPLTRAAWIAKGDNICGRLTAELDTAKVRTMREIPRVLPQSAAYERAAVVQLAKLVPPTAMTSDWQHYLNDSLQLAEDGAKLAQSTNLGEGITKAPLFTAMATLRAHYNKIARRDGFKICSSV